MGKLASERVVIQSPMSFTGATRRLGQHWWAWPLIPVAWAVIAVWYVLFGLFVFPYRLVRRGSRKRKLENLRHRERLEN